jgi:hypothetical protein
MASSQSDYFLEYKLREPGKGIAIAFSLMVACEDEPAYDKHALHF